MTHTGAFALSSWSHPHGCLPLGPWEKSPLSPCRRSLSSSPRPLAPEPLLFSLPLPYLMASDSVPVSSWVHGESSSDLPQRGCMSGWARHGRKKETKCAATCAHQLETFLKVKMCRLHTNIQYRVKPISIQRNVEEWNCSWHQWRQLFPKLRNFHLYT